MLARTHCCAHTPVPAPERRDTVVLSRADMGRRRSLVNQPALLRVIAAALPAEPLVVFEGSKGLSLAQTA